MTEAARREEAFRSALERLPIAVLVVDGQRRILPYNQRATKLFEEEALRGDLLTSRPSHPLSRVIMETLSSSRNHPEERSVTFPSERRYRIEPSRRSEKGMDRWLMLLVTPIGEQQAMQTPALDTLALTPREREVALLLLAGASTVEVCTALSISRETLKTHAKRLFEKSGVRTRTAFVAKMLRPS